MINKRVLVTGGAGFIGSHVVDALLEAGYQPVVIDNLSTGRRDNLPPGVPLYEADICDQAALAATFSAVRPALICHQAAQMSVSRSVREPALDAEVNILGLVRVLEQGLRTGVKRIVFASSGGAMYGDVRGPASEDMPPQPISPYGISKWVGEAYLRFFAREFGLQAVALRYGNVYGPRQNPHGEAGVVAIFAQRLLAGEPPVIFGDGQQVRDYVHVKDVARANLLALTAALDSDFMALNIGTATGTDVNHLDQQLRTALQHFFIAMNRGGSLPAAQYAAPRPGDLRASILSPDRAAAVLGWAPRIPLRRGLQDTVRWFADQTVVCQP